MSATPSLFQSTVAKSLTWVDEVMSTLAIHEEHQGLRALRAGLHAIRDNLPIAEVVDLGAQLPALIRGLYYEGWRPGAHHERTHHASELYAAIRQELGNDHSSSPEAIVRATIRVLRNHVSAGELAQVEHVLPRKLAELWHDPRGPS